MSRDNAATPADNVVPLRRRSPSPCPICRKPSVPDYRPFCSKRCADVDLHRWLGEDYRIPSEEPPDGFEGGGIGDGGDGYGEDGRS